ncbi:hypothetical protein [Paraliomyxa miuraensis]|uniref:hypothetical protein n=1 Tax=Paraliomyxa miuraensis TaxID=376150 RepID=UPI0022564AA0|nr:hypothetical protein [Paraliomyxa miuraensis]MCX4247285.1 hypothetical protein [Paraliomyxa miuraensis]
MPAHRHATRCASCHEHAVVRPSAAWKAALVGGYVLFGMMVFGASLLGPTIIAVLPLLMATGFGLLPFLHERAGAQAACAACGKLASDEEPEATPRSLAIELARAA